MKKRKGIFPANATPTEYPRYVPEKILNEIKALAIASALGPSVFTDGKDKAGESAAQSPACAHPFFMLTRIPAA